MRRRLGELAVKAAKSINYFSAGTIEFLLDSEHNFYFMEMNTRIQVEHPVTEMVTGIDLIKEQIRIASGQRLRLHQDDVQIDGASMECRINAEDYLNDFAPCPGKIDLLILPGGAGVRLDTHIYSGYEITPHYDSLIAKLIAYGSNRLEVINIMKRALGEFIIEPIKTTIPFHQRLLLNPYFIKGETSTHFVQEMLKQAGIGKGE